MSDRLAVVVVSFRSQHELPGCLEALIDDGCASRVLVVDNASDDGSVEAAEAAAVADARVAVHPMETNTGFAGGCNRGLAALGDEIAYVAFMNPDVEVEPGCLARCVAELEARPDAAAAAPRLMRPDGATVDSVGQVLHHRTLEVADRGYDRPVTHDLLAPCDVLAGCGALAVFRRAALDDVAEKSGPWAEHFFCFWEDLELGWRLNNRGWSVISVPDAVAVHGRGAGARSGRGPLRWRRPPELEACIVSNRWMTLIRHLHTLDVIRRLPLPLVWDLPLVVLSAVRRPRFAVELTRRLPLVYREWRGRERLPRRRLAELPWKFD
jgi:GT2 family glycosyltransferase